MIPAWPRAAGEPGVRARLRASNADFEVIEELGFEPGGGGEHAFLYLQKSGLTTADLVQRIAALSGVPPRDIGFSGLKDRNAVTRQWLSVRLAGRAEPDWHQLEIPGQLAILRSARHPRKLKRGVHRANRFRLYLRQLQGDLEALPARLEQVAACGVPNYFGEQRFGRGGSTLSEARRWALQSGRRISRARRSLYLSALRALLFNQLLAQRVREGTWDQVLADDACALQGSRSLFPVGSGEPALELRQRAARGDIHPALPLCGRGRAISGPAQQGWQSDVLLPEQALCQFLIDTGLELAYRAARVIPGDFCWQFCDDGSLRLEFALPAGSYATAVVAELVQHWQGDTE